MYRSMEFKSIYLFIKILFAPQIISSRLSHCLYILKHAKNALSLHTNHIKFDDTKF